MKTVTLQASVRDEAFWTAWAFPSAVVHGQRHEIVVLSDGVSKRVELASVHSEPKGELARLVRNRWKYLPAVVVADDGVSDRPSPATMMV